jgi:hypothetical protein
MTYTTFPYMNGRINTASKLAPFEQGGSSAMDKTLDEHPYLGTYLGHMRWKSDHKVAMFVVAMPLRFGQTHYLLQSLDPTIRGEDSPLLSNKEYGALITFQLSQGKDSHEN